MSRIDLMGCPVDALTLDQTLARIEALVADGVAHGRTHQHMAVNANKLVTMAHDPEIAAVVRRCDLISADGAGVVLASRVLGCPVPERVTGVDLFDALLAMAPSRGWRPYFLGARQEVVARVVELARERNPGLDVAGWRDGYFSAEQEPAVADAIRESGAHLLFVAISSPKKEQLLGRWLTRMAVPFAMGVGGSFDVYAGVTARAPGWAQRHHLEWAFRLAQEPGRMWRRNLFGSGEFVARVALHAATGWRIP